MAMRLPSLLKDKDAEAREELQLSASVQMAEDTGKVVQLIANSDRLLSIQNGILASMNATLLELVRITASAWSEKTDLAGPFSSLDGRGEAELQKVEEKRDTNELEKKKPKIDPVEKKGKSSFESFFQSINGFVTVLKTLAIPYIIGFALGVNDVFPYLKTLKDMFIGFVTGLQDVLTFVSEMMRGGITFVGDKIIELGSSFGEDSTLGAGIRWIGESVNSLGDMLANLTDNLLIASLAIAPIALVFRKTFGTIMGWFGDLFKSIRSLNTGKVFGALKSMMSGLEKIGEFLLKAGRVVGKLFLPLTVLLGAIDGVVGAIKGYEAEGIVGAVKGALAGIVSGLVGWIGDLAGWLVGSLLEMFGFEELGKSMKDFDFTAMVSNVIYRVLESVQALFESIVDSVKSSFAALAEGDILGAFAKIMFAPIQAAIDAATQIMGFSPIQIAKDLAKMIFDFTPSLLAALWPDELIEWMNKKEPGPTAYARNVRKEETAPGTTPEIKLTDVDSPQVAAQQGRPAIDLSALTNTPTTTTRNATAAPVDPKQAEVTRLLEQEYGRQGIAPVAGQTPDISPRFAPMTPITARPMPPKMTGEMLAMREEQIRDRTAASKAASSAATVNAINSSKTNVNNAVNNFQNIGAGTAVEFAPYV